MLGNTWCDILFYIVCCIRCDKGAIGIQCWGTLGKTYRVIVCSIQCWETLGVTYCSILYVVLGVMQEQLVFSVEEHLVRHTVLLFVAYSVGKHLV